MANKIDNKPLLDLGARVLAHVEGGPGIEEGYHPGTIVEYKGKVDIYDGRVSQDKVNFSIRQHFYLIELEQGGHVLQFETRVRLDPRYC